jgi:hypothetical protein
MTPERGTRECATSGGTGADRGFVLVVVKDATEADYSAGLLAITTDLR